MLIIELVLMRARPARALSLRLARICPSSNCHARVRARALCGSPFRRRRRPPIRNLPDRVGCFRIRRGIAKINRDRHSVANCKLDRVQVVTKKLVQRQHILLDFFEDIYAALAIRFDTASDKDDAARTA